MLCLFSQSDIISSYFTDLYNMNLESMLIKDLLVSSRSCSIENAIFRLTPHITLHVIFVAQQIYE